MSVPCCLGLMPMNKYGARKITRNGETFDSVKEYRRYLELCLLEKAGEIKELKRQVPFELIPTQREPETVGARGAVKPGRVIEKSVVYNADFTYYENGRYIVEDTKGMRTKDYIIKRKLMLYIHKIKIKEI